MQNLPTYTYQSFQSTTHFYFHSQESSHEMLQVNSSKYFFWWCCGFRYFIFNFLLRVIKCRRFLTRKWGEKNIKNIIYSALLDAPEQNAKRKKSTKEIFYFYFYIQRREKLTIITIFNYAFSCGLHIVFMMFLRFRFFLEKKTWGVSSLRLYSNPFFPQLKWEEKI